MMNFSTVGLWRRPATWLVPVLTGLALLLAPAAEAQTLTLQGTGSASAPGNDVTAFVDKVEIVRVVDGVVMTGALINAGFEAPALGAGSFAYRPGGATWTFLNNTGISSTGGGFSPPAIQEGSQTALIQTSPSSISQPLTLAAGTYRVRFLATQRNNCCGAPYDQVVVVKVGSTQVGLTTPPVGGFVTYTSNAFTVDGSGAVTTNNALAFDGTNDFVALPATTPVPVGNSSYTIEAWIKPTVMGDYGIIGWGNYNSNNQVNALRLYNGGLVNYWWANDLITPTASLAGAWHHVAATFDGTTRRLYLDGAQVGSDMPGAGHAVPNANNLRIGSTNVNTAGNPGGTNEYFPGSIDEVRVYNTGLTTAQIQADMFSTNPAVPGNQVAYYNFDQGTAGGNNAGTTTLPNLANANPGTLTNFALTGTTSNWVRSFPTITGISPSSGAVGSSVTVTGTNLLDANGFKFNTAAVAPFTTPTDDFFTTLTVPTGASTGPVSTASAQLTTFTGPVFTVVTDLVVNTGTQLIPTTIPAGSYNSITITNVGNGVLAGNVSVATFLTVQPGGGLSDGCAIISGAGTFTLGAGSTLGICSPQGITASGATGSVQVTGTRSFSTAANYGYTGAATVTGNGLPATVASLAINTAGNVTLSNPVAVTAAVGVGGAGNLLLNGNNLTLLSSASGTALARNSSTGIVVGTATVQRFISSANTGLGYRHYSAPVSGSTVSDLATATGFTPEISQGDVYNASATPGTTTPFPTVFAYDQIRVQMSNTFAPFDRGFVVPSASNPFLTLTVGRGYAVNLAANQLVDFVGTLTTGAVTRTLARNAAGTANESEAGWHLVGNPYPSPIDYSLVSPAATGLEDAMYVFESAGQYTGSYRSFVNGLPAANRFVGTAQGFFVRVLAGQTSGTLNFGNNQRVTDPTVQVPFRRDAPDLRPLVQLDLRSATGLADAFYAYAQPGATPAFDAAFDARKLPNTTGLNLASAAAGDALSIDGRPAFAAGTALALSVGVPTAGTYTLTAAALANLPAGLDAFLTDAATGQRVNLRTQPAYAFSVSAAQAASALTGRFTLSFGAAAPLSTASALTAAAVSLYPNPAHAAFTVQMPAIAGATAVQATLLNALGQVVRRTGTALPATGASFTVETAGLAAGVYTLRLQAGAASLAKRVVVQ